jgi:hypothetical protein
MEQSRRSTALVQPIDSTDVFRCNLHQNGQFFVNSVYLAQNNNGFVDTIGKCAGTNTFENKDFHVVCVQRSYPN